LRYRGFYERLWAISRDCSAVSSSSFRTPPDREEWDLAGEEAVADLAAAAVSEASEEAAAEVAGRAINTIDSTYKIYTTI